MQSRRRGAPGRAGERLRREQRRAVLDVVRQAERVQREGQQHGGGG